MMVDVMMRTNKRDNPEGTAPAAPESLDSMSLSDYSLQSDEETESLGKRFGRKLAIGAALGAAAWTGYEAGGSQPSPQPPAVAASEAELRSFSEVLLGLKTNKVEAVAEAIDHIYGRSSISEREFHALIEALEPSKSSSYWSTNTLIDFVTERNGSAPYAESKTLDIVGIGIIAIEKVDCSQNPFAFKSAVGTLLRRAHSSENSFHFNQAEHLKFLRRFEDRIDRIVVEKTRS